MYVTAKAESYVARKGTDINYV